MPRDNDLTSKLLSEISHVNDSSADLLERMKQDSKLRLSDFIPYFGERNYERRTLIYEVAFTFSSKLEGDRKFLSQIKKRQGVLKDYNTGLIALALGTVVLAIRDYLSKP